MRAETTGAAVLHRCCSGVAVLHRQVGAAVLQSLSRGTHCYTGDAPEAGESDEVLHLTIGWRFASGRSLPEAVATLASRPGPLPPIRSRGNSCRRHTVTPYAGGLPTTKTCVCPDGAPSRKPGQSDCAGLCHPRLSGAIRAIRERSACNRADSLRIASAKGNAPFSKTSVGAEELPTVGGGTNARRGPSESRFSREARP
jgi:hypothetical protein